MHTVFKQNFKIISQELESLSGFPAVALCCAFIFKGGGGTWRGLLLTFCWDPHQRPVCLSWAGVLFSFPWAPVYESKHSRSASDHITSNRLGHPAVCRHS